MFGEGSTLESKCTAFRKEAFFMDEDESRGVLVLEV